MKSLHFALLRLKYSAAFWIFTLLTLLLPLLAYRAADEVALPPAGFCLEENADADASRIAAILEEEGFLAYDSAEALERAVASGALDAGILIPASLSEALHAGKPAGLISFISSPLSLAPDLWREHAAAALYTVYAPYITEKALSKSDIDAREIYDAYYEMLGEGRLFTFRMESLAGAVLEPEEGRRDRFFLGALALMAFTAVYFGIAEPLLRDVKDLESRIGRSRAWSRLFLPGALLRLLLLFAAAAAAELACGKEKLLIPTLIYLLLLTLYSLLLLLLPGQSWQRVLVCLLILLSLAACPIYTDLALFWAPLEKLRVLLPPYSLWLLS